MCGAIKKQQPGQALRDAMRGRSDKEYRKSQICELQQPVVAAVFSDGSTTGDPALLARLLLRRSNMLLAIDTTIETSSRAGRHNVPRVGKLMALPPVELGSPFPPIDFVRQEVAALKVQRLALVRLQPGL